MVRRDILLSHSRFFDFGSIAVHTVVTSTLCMLFCVVLSVIRLPQGAKVVAAFWGIYVVLIGMVCYTWQRLFEYLALQSHLDTNNLNQPWYHRLEKLLPSFTSELLSFDEKVKLLFLHALLLPVKLYAWSCTLLQRITTFLRPSDWAITRQESQIRL